MARIKMHIPKAKLPFYPPYEVKCRLQNGVSTTYRVLEFKELEYCVVYMVLEFKELEYYQHKTRAYRPRVQGGIFN